MATPTHTVFSYFLSRTVVDFFFFFFWMNNTVVDFNVLASGRVETRKYRTTKKKNIYIYIYIYYFSLFNL